MFSATALSEDVDQLTVQQNKNLLSAPGTVTGKKNEMQQSSDLKTPSTSISEPFQQRRSRYKYVGESTKFRQFGQKSGQNNPWYKEFNSNYPRQPLPSNMPPITNPWQLGGMPPLRSMLGGQTDAFSGRSPAPYGRDNFSSSDKLYPDFPGGIYRDTNPAAFPMPRFGGDKFDFPFSPFGMF